MTQVLDELQDGFTCTVSFAEDATVEVKTISVKPPGITGSGAVDQTTMHNVAYNTQLPSPLAKISDMTETVAYAPAAFAKLVAMRGVLQLITWTWPDGSDPGEAWGWIETFEPGELVIGSRPTATITIMFSCLNSTGVETGPSWVTA